jgi:hypothetical protein
MHDSSIINTSFFLSMETLDFFHNLSTTVDAESGILPQQLIYRSTAKLDHEQP